MPDDDDDDDERDKKKIVRNKQPLNSDLKANV